MRKMEENEAELRMRKVGKMEMTKKEDGRTVTQTAAGHIIELTDVVQRFGEKDVLKDITLRVESGEIFGLLGPSGAGKTTIIKIVTGQLRPTEGNAVTNGVPADKMTGKAYRRIGMMMDVPGLYERLSCYDNLKLFARLYAVKEKRIREVLEKVGLLEAARRPVEKLSKGMKGRLALARAVMNEPDILFLDEPTSGLDPATANRIHELILEEQAKGTTVFLTTHNMAEAEKLCRHIALLHEGNIIEYGGPEEICRRYNHKKQILVRLYDGRTMVCPYDRKAGGDKETAEMIRQYLESGMVETIHSTEPSLETVFMELTGKKLC